MPAPRSSVVFYASLQIVVAIVLLGWLVPDHFGAMTHSIYSALSTNVGWWYLVAMNVFVLFSIILACGRFAHVRLGKDDEKPEFSTMTWLGMLFAVGQGVGLVFYGAGEPLTHFSLLPYGAEANSAQAASDAIRGTFVHWGLHPWGAYSVIALCLAYFQYRKGAPGLMSSLLIPLLGPTASGKPLGICVNIAAIFATVAGVSTSLGLAVMQISSGLHYVFGIADTTTVRVSVVVILGVLFLTCSMLGLDKGIKRLSSVNMSIYISLGVLVFVFGPTILIVETFFSGIGTYLSTIIQESFDTAPFNVEFKKWINNWTIYYWGWWISWAPFVGAFIARISRGRTIREFVAGVLLLPSLGCFVWIAIFGGTGLWIQLSGLADLATSVQASIATGVYVMYDELLFGGIMSILTLVLLACLFITSGSSSTFVLSMYSTDGNSNPGKMYVAVWGTMLVVLVVVLLLSGGLRALQTISLVAAAPFSVVMVAACVCLWRALQQDIPVAPKKA